jgi:hypothetical protein
MTLKNLLSKYTTDSIIEAILKYDEKSDEESYRSAIEELKEKQEIIEYDGIDIITYADENGFNGYCCEGIDNTGQIWGLDYISWGEWLGKEIRPESFEVLSEKEVLAIILWQITFNGYTEDNLIEAKKELERRMEEFDTAIDKGEIITLSLEDIFGKDNVHSEKFDLITKFYELWKKVPDLRFGELVHVLCGFIRHDGDIFIPKNEEWKEAINKYTKEVNSKDNKS